VIQAVTLSRTTIPASTQPFSARPKKACGAESSVTRSGRCITPTFASSPSASARARVYETRKVPMIPSRPTMTIGTLLCTGFIA
jgi:hypothetical protein